MAIQAIVCNNNNEKGKIYNYCFVNIKKKQQSANKIRMGGLIDIFALENRLIYVIQLDRQIAKEKEREIDRERIVRTKFQSKRIIVYTRIILVVFIFCHIL